MNNPTVDLTSGTIVGVRVGDVVSYKGIPFAAPPVGDLRFAPPTPVRPWSGVKDCTGYGPISLQHLDPLSAFIPGCEWNFYHPGAVQSEDCLNLNVWAPANVPQSKAVLVWLHGGAFVAGSGTGLWYDGSQLVIHEDIIVVSVNYRLGALGALAHDESASAGNNLIRDQVAALEWVRDNIAAFGGDPDRVTIAGESAGAISVLALMTAPAAAGLFRAAISQSGHGSASATREAARSVYRRFLAELGVADSSAALTELRALDSRKIMDAQLKVTTDLRVPFRPVIDGSYLPEPIDATFAAGRVARVPLLIGINSEESRLFAAIGWGLGPAGDDLQSRIAGLFPEGEASSQVAELTDIYRQQASSDEDAWLALSTDRDWRTPVRIIADGHARSGSPVFQYEFTWRSPVREGILGASHALDIPFPFGNLDQPGVGEFVGTDAEHEAARRRIELAFRQAWGAFVRTGHPRSEVLPEWQRYEARDRATMMLGTQSEIVKAPHQAALDRWEALSASTLPLISMEATGNH